MKSRFFLTSARQGPPPRPQFFLRLSFIRSGSGECCNYSRPADFTDFDIDNFVSIMINTRSMVVLLQRRVARQRVVYRLKTSGKSPFRDHRISNKWCADDAISTLRRFDEEVHLGDEC